MRIRSSDNLLLLGHLFFLCCQFWVFIFSFACAGEQLTLFLLWLDSLRFSFINWSNGPLCGVLADFLMCSSAFFSFSFLTWFLLFFLRACFLKVQLMLVGDETLLGFWLSCFCRGVSFFSVFFYFYLSLFYLFGF